MWADGGLFAGHLKTQMTHTAQDTSRVDGGGRQIDLHEKYITSYNTDNEHRLRSNQYA